MNNRSGRGTGGSRAYQRYCPYCQGHGHLLNYQIPCRACYGTGYIAQSPGVAQNITDNSASALDRAIARSKAKSGA